MQALVFHATGQALPLEQRPDLQPAEGEVVVQLKAAALNRRDYWITQGMYPGVRAPVILGSDGAGLVTKIGDGVPHHWSSQPAIINPGWDWGDSPRVQSDRFRILGMPDDGTFATEVRVPHEYLHAKPERLDWHTAAALPLGGVTAYRAVFTQGGLREDAVTRVLISGIGGGVATFALQYAVAAGAEVFVTSSSRDKLQRAMKRGAAGGFDYTADGWAREAQSACGGFDLIVDSAGGDGYEKLVDLAAPGGTIVNYGATAGPPKKLDLFKVFWKQLHLVGSTMGSRDDFAAMLELVERQRITPVVDEVFPLADGNQALSRMKDSRQFGKIVLELP